MNIEKENLIPFTNLVNECCEVMDHDGVADWLTSPNVEKLASGTSLLASIT